MDGITPNGLLRIPQRCPSLCSIQLAMDVRGYTERPPSPASFGWILIDVFDSPIEAESVAAVSAFFSGIFGSPRHHHVFMNAWNCKNNESIPDLDEERWTEARRQVQPEDAVGPARQPACNGVRV